MVGQYNFVVRSARVEYHFTLSRKVAVVKGKSGRGKTHLYNLLERLREDIKDETSSSVHCNYADRVRVLSLDSWQEVVKEHNKFVFADETDSALRNTAFLDAISGSDNYYIFITRGANLRRVGYSVDSIFVMDTNAKEGLQVSTSFCHRYAAMPIPPSGVPDVIVTEDTNSGFDMFSKVFKNVRVLSAGGKDNVLNTLKDCIRAGDKSAYIIVDGAAFGGCLQQLQTYFARSSFKWNVVAPESFEWLLLQTRVFRGMLKDELVATWKYCDVSVWETWEQYYTDLIIEKSAKRGAVYTKKYLTSWFSTNTVVNDVISLTKKLDLGCFIQEVDL